MNGQDGEMRASPGDREPEPPAGEPLEEGPGGPFASWRSLYVTLFLYSGVMVLVLLMLTRLLNRGGP